MSLGWTVCFSGSAEPSHNTTTEYNTALDLEEAFFLRYITLHGRKYFHCRITVGRAFPNGSSRRIITGTINYISGGKRIDI